MDNQHRYYKETFSMFDRNKDGHISVYELGVAMRSAGKNPTLSEIEDMIKHVDKNENGMIEYNEFVGLLEVFDQKHPDPDQELLEAFKVFDLDGNGKISAKELKTVLKNRGDTLSDEEIEGTMASADINNDGYLDYQEFAEMMKVPSLKGKNVNSRKYCEDN